MGRKSKIDVSDVPATNPKAFERDKQMFVDWMNGMTQPEIAKKYEISPSNVTKVARKYNWRDKRRQINQREFSDVINDLQGIATKTSHILKGDVIRIVKKFNSSDEPLTGEERAHLRALLDRILKELRLEDGKPTEISNEPVQIVLPAGVKDFGVIPTTGRTVKVIETEEINEDKEDFDIDDVDPST